MCGIFIFKGTETRQHIIENNTTYMALKLASQKWNLLFNIRGLWRYLHIADFQNILMKATNSVSEGGRAEHFTVQLKTVMISLCSKHTVKQHRIAFLTPKGMNIPYFLTLLAVLGNRAANSTAQLFLMAHMNTDIEPIQIPVLRSPVFPDVLLLIWQWPVWGSGISLCWKHSLLLAGCSLGNTFTF